MGYVILGPSRGLGSVSVNPRQKLTPGVALMVYVGAFWGQGFLPISGEGAVLEEFWLVLPHLEGAIWRVTWHFVSPIWGAIWGVIWLVFPPFGGQFGGNLAGLPCIWGAIW